MDVRAVLIRAVIGPLWARWEGSSYLRYCRELRRTQFDDPGTIRVRQWSRIKAQVRHAYATVPFYRERLDSLSIKPESIKDFESFRRLPLLTKDDIRRAGSRLLSSALAPGELRRKTTSGSTGVALEIFVDEPSMQCKRACTLRSDEWSGWRFGERVAKVWGNPEYLRKGWRGRLRNALLERASYLDTLHLTEQTLEAFAKDLRRHPPSLLFGHAHSLFLLAQYLKDRGRGDIRPRGIISTAMVLHAWQRRLIEAVFACPVTNRYGCEEVSLIACECERHDGLHINSDGVYVEILNGGRPAAPGEAGHIVVTDLTNQAMPLIRYQVGDMAVSSGRRCPCGRGLPLLESIEGREADYVVTARGELISGISLTENFALEVPGIAQIQIVQEQVDRFLFRMVRSDDFNAGSLRQLKEMVQRRFGASATFACEYVDRIPQEPSGKYRFCISRVPKPLTHLYEEALAP
jgi:phenylacetate-CoA ligase